MANIILSSSTNPDAIDILYKRPINILLSEFDISASGYSSSINVATQTDTISIVVGSEEYTGTMGTRYYTPIYTEKISYEQWQSRINKNFSELE